MNDEHDLEKDFERLVPLHTPPGLRERVLSAALEARRDAALTPRMRLSSVICAILIVALFGIDRLVGRQEAVRMAVVLDGRPPAVMAGMEDGEIAEMAGLEGAEADRMIKLLALASFAEREKRQGRLDEALRGPKGWSTYEISENLD
jgi:hypothetical protein